MPPLKPKILLLITNLNFGGAQRVFHTISKVLADEFTVIECVFNREEPVAFPSNNELISLDVPAGKNLVDKLYRFIQRVLRLRKIKKKYNIEVCISHLEGADLVNVLSGVSKNITWVHGSKRHDKNISGIIGYLRHRLLIPFAYIKSDLVITVSEEIKRELHRFYKVRSDVRTLHNYFDTGFIRRKADETVPAGYDQIFGNGHVIVFSGRFAEQKNLREFLLWFSHFLNFHSAKLVLVGDGELRSELLQLCTQLQMKVYHPWGTLALHGSYQVYFLGYMENPHPVVKKSDLFLLPSSWEGFPMVLGEAMACGTPIVSADCPTGPREFLSDEIDSILNYPNYNQYGVLLPVLTNDKYQIWTDAVKNVLTNEMIKANYQRQSLVRAEFFSLEKNRHKIVDLVSALNPIPKSAKR
jgi:glycosyltransferase involved in cell wall biosynthesis